MKKTKKRKEIEEGITFAVDECLPGHTGPGGSPFP